MNKTFPFPSFMLFLYMDLVLSSLLFLHHHQHWHITQPSNQTSDIFFLSILWCSSRVVQRNAKLCTTAWCCLSPLKAASTHVLVSCHLSSLRVAHATLGISLPSQPLYAQWIVFPRPNETNVISVFERPQCLFYSGMVKSKARNNSWCCSSE